MKRKASCTDKQASFFKVKKPIVLIIKVFKTVISKFIINTITIQKTFITSKRTAKTFDKMIQKNTT